MPEECEEPTCLIPYGQCRVPRLLRRNPAAVTEYAAADALRDRACSAQNCGFCRRFRIFWNDFGFELGAIVASRHMEAAFSVRKR